MTKLMNISKTKQGRSISGRGSPIVTSCLSKCARPGIDPKEMTEHQNWLQDKFGFLRLHIRRKGLIKSSGFKSQAQGASPSAHNVSQASTNTDSLEISPRSKLQPQQVSSPPQLQGALRSTSRSWTSSHR